MITGNVCLSGLGRSFTVPRSGEHGAVGPPRRHDHDRDLGRGQLRRGQDPGQRPGHPARHPAADLGSVLHHQGRRRGHGTGPVDRPRARRAPRRHDRVPDHGRRRDHVRRQAAAPDPGRRQGPQREAHGAAGVVARELSASIRRDRCTYAFALRLDPSSSVPICRRSRYPL